MLSKQDSKVYVNDLYCKTLTNSMMNFVELSRYDLDCKSFGIFVSWNYNVPTHCMPIIKNTTWDLPSHVLAC